LVAITQIALILPAWTASNMSTAFRPGARAVSGAPQKRATRSRSARGEVHVAGQGVGHAAGLAPAHGVGLAGDRERAGARLADPPGGQVGVEDRQPLATPWADWLAPIENRLTVRSWAANRS
jgi:hypothetical protein